MWLSVHIFHKNHLYSYESDRIILEVVKPFVEMCERENLIQKYFFIRYSENGPHIRLRLEVETPERLIELKIMLMEYIPDKYPEELHIEENNPWNNNSVYQFIEYEPEVDRYGGIEGVKIAEEYFYYSSRIAISLIKEINKGNNSERLGKGLFIILVSLFIFSGDVSKCSEIMENYSKGYLTNILKEPKKQEDYNKAYKLGYETQKSFLNEHIENIWAVLKASDDLDYELNEYIINVKIIKEKLESLLNQALLKRDEYVFSNSEDILKIIVPSYIHMMNNRLGISIPEEAYLAIIISKAFSNYVWSS
jgi:thiopeptide-type bacteriocin biosynthesis protein